LGRRRSGLGRGGARLRGDMAKPTEVGRVASLKPVGSNATLVKDGIEAVIRGLKAQLVGEIEVAGLDLAGSLTDLGLMMSIDFTSTPSYVVVERHSSPTPSRRSAL